MMCVSSACLIPHIDAGAALAGDTLSGTALMLLEGDGALVCLRPQRHARHQAEQAHELEPHSTAASRQPGSISSEYQVQSSRCSFHHGPCVACCHHSVDTS